jgi:hypothetical protein
VGWPAGSAVCADEIAAVADRVARASKAVVVSLGISNPSTGLDVGLGKTITRLRMLGLEEI